MSDFASKSLHHIIATGFIGIADDGSRSEFFLPLLWSSVQEALSPGLTGFNIVEDISRSSGGIANKIIMDTLVYLGMSFTKFYDADSSGDYAQGFPIVTEKDPSIISYIGDKSSDFSNRLKIFMNNMDSQPQYDLLFGTHPKGHQILSLLRKESRGINNN